MMTRASQDRAVRLKASRDKTRAYRARMRKQGMRPIQLWVPDVNVPSFAEEMRREGEIISRAAASDADQAFVDAITIDW